MNGSEQLLLAAPGTATSDRVLTKASYVFSPNAAFDEFEETTLAEASEFIWGRTAFMWGKTTEFDWRTAATDDTAEDGSDD